MKYEQEQHIGTATYIKGHTVGRNLCDHEIVPESGDVEAYHAMEKAVADGKIRSLGLSNWYVEELEEFLTQINIMPAPGSEWHIIPMAVLLRNKMTPMCVRQSPEG